MAKSHKRPVYRKDGSGILFVKVYPNNTAVIVEPKNLFTEAIIKKEKIFSRPDFLKNLVVCRKKDFINEYRKCLKSIKI
jgi:hypothetical protein